MRIRSRRFRAQPRKPLSRKSVFLITVVVTVALTMQAFLFLDRNIKEPLMNVARIRVKQVAAEAINKAIADQAAHLTEIDKLFDRWTNYSGDITGLALNYSEHLKISQEVVAIVNEALRSRVNMVERVPIGQALGSPILSTIGPRISLHFESAGAPTVEVGTRREDAGINMLLITVFVRVTAEVMIYIPFDTQPEIVTTEIPISYILVKGDVPMYYFDANGNPLGSGSGGGSTLLPPSVAIPSVLPSAAPTAGGAEE